MEAALQEKNGTATGNDNINIETLKAGEDTISKTIAKLYTKCLSERGTPTTWNNANVIIFVNKKCLKNYRPICILSNIYKVLMEVLKDQRSNLTKISPKSKQKQILNDRPHPPRIPTLREVQRIQYPTLHRIRRLRYNLLLSAHTSSTNIASKTGDRKCVHRTVEGHLHQQLDDGPPTQIKQQDQHQEESTTRRDHIAQAVYGSTRKHMSTWETRGLKIDGEYLSHLRFADAIRICANTQHELQ